MGQDEIMTILKESNVPLSALEIANIMNTRFPDASADSSAINKKIKQMIKYNEVDVIILPKELALKFFKCKKRLRLYYV